MRHLRDAAAKGHERAKIALEVYAYRVKKRIGSYAAAMGGVDGIIFPVPGDIAFGYKPPYARPGMPEELYDIAIFYGPGRRRFTSSGWFPMNSFAKITERLEEFAKMCAKLRTEGLKEMVISRVEQ